MNETNASAWYTARSNSEQSSIYDSSRWMSLRQCGISIEEYHCVESLQKSISNDSKLHKDISVLLSQTATKIDYITSLNNNKSHKNRIYLFWGIQNDVDVLLQGLMITVKSGKQITISILSTVAPENRIGLFNEPSGQTIFRCFMAQIKKLDTLTFVVESLRIAFPFWYQMGFQKSYSKICMQDKWDSLIHYCRTHKCNRYNTIPISEWPFDVDLVKLGFSKSLLPEEFSLLIPYTRAEFNRIRQKNVNIVSNVSECSIPSELDCHKRRRVTRC